MPTKTRPRQRRGFEVLHRSQKSIRTRGHEPARWLRVSSTPSGTVATFHVARRVQDPEARVPRCWWTTRLLSQLVTSCDL